MSSDSFDKSASKNRRAAPEPQVRRMLNVPLLLGTAIAAAVVCPAAYCWHAFQSRHTAGALEERASDLAEAKEYAKAAEYFERCSRMDPANPEVRIRLAETFDKSGGSRLTAADLYGDALKVAPVDRERDLRWRLAELRLELGRIPWEGQAEYLGLAEADAKDLLAGKADDPRATRVLALALYEQFQTGTLAASYQSGITVGDAFERALALSPADVELSATLARIWRDHEDLLSDGQRKRARGAAEGIPGPDKAARYQLARATIADGIVDQMMERGQNARDPRTLLVRYRYRTHYGVSGAEQDLEAALKYGPDDVDVLVTAAERARYEAARARQKGAPRAEIATYLAEARRHYTHAIDLDRSAVQAYLGLGDVCREQGETGQAVNQWRRGLEEAGGNRWGALQLNLRMAEVRLGEGRPDDAGNSLDAVQKDLEGLNLVPEARRPEGFEYDRQSIEGAYKLLRAKWLMAKQQLRKAIPLLTEIALGQQSTASEIANCVRAGIFLGQTHAALAKTAAAADERDKEWEAAALAYGRAAELQPNDWLLQVSTSECWKKAGKAKNAEPYRARAKDLLTKMENEAPGSGRLFQTLAFLYEAIGCPADADRMLEKFDAVASQPAARPLLRARLYCVRNRYAEARQVLREGIQTLPPQVRPALECGLVQVSFQEGNAKQANEDLTRLFEKYLPIEAGSLRAYIASDGFPWLAACVFNGQVLEYQGKIEEAVGLYQEAIDLGEQSPLVYERVVYLLSQLRRFDEADQYLSQLKASGRWSQNLLGYEIYAAGRQGGLPEALKAARHETDIRPGDPTARLWYARILAADGRQEEAEGAFKQALKLAPKDVRSHLALFNFYVGTRRRQEAEKSLQALAKEAQLSELERALVLAQAYQRLGDRERADVKYREAGKLAPVNAGVQMGLAKFLLETEGLQSTEAEGILRRIAPQSGDARRTLAGLLAARGGEKEWEEAQRLLEKAGAEGATSNLDKRLGAALLVRRGGRDNVGKARQLLEGLVADSENATAADRLSLARLYEAEGDLPAARQQCLALVASGNPAPAHLAFYAELLLRHNSQDEATQWVEQLEKAAPGQFPTARLRAYWLRTQGREAEISGVIEPVAEKLWESCKKDEARKAQVAFTVGNLYASMGQLQAAKPWYGRLVGRPDPSVSQLVLYTDLLLQMGDYREASDWLRKLDEKAPDNLATLSLTARWLHGQGRASEIAPLVESRAEKAFKQLEKDTQRSLFCQGVGSIYSAVGQHQPAERWYRRVVGLSPEQYGPLAECLVAQGRGADALRLCTEAAKSDASARPALVAASILVAIDPTPETSELAEPLLSGAVGSHPDDVDLLMQVGNARIRQGRVDEAIRFYEQALRLRPKIALAMNNLATLLAEQPGGAEKALQLVEQAIEITGPTPQLLDTKGTALIHDGKPAQAIPVLEKAASSLRPDPRFPFHLAVAYHRAGQPAQAKEVFARVLGANLEKQILTKKDRELLAELEEKYR